MTLAITKEPLVPIISLRIRCHIRTLVSITIKMREVAVYPATVHKRLPSAPVVLLYKFAAGLRTHAVDHKLSPLTTEGDVARGNEK